MKGKAFIIIWGNEKPYTLCYPESGSTVGSDLMAYFEKYLRDKKLPFDAAWAEKMLLKSDKFFQRQSRLDRYTRFIYELDTIDREVRGYKRYFDGSVQKMDFSKAWNSLCCMPKDQRPSLKEEDD